MPCRAVQEFPDISLRDRRVYTGNKADTGLLCVPQKWFLVKNALGVGADVIAIVGNAVGEEVASSSHSCMIFCAFSHPATR